MELRDLSAHSARRPGRGVEARAREIGVDPDDVLALDLNQTPFGPSPAAVAAVHEHADGMHRYPTAAHADLREAIADYWSPDARPWGVDDEQIWLSPGGTFALDYLARAFLDPGQRVLLSRPGFAYTSMSARYHRAEVDTYRLEKDDEFAQTAETVLDAYDGHRIVYVTSPHNPTGSVMDTADLKRVADGTHEDTLLVVDEAYQQFADEPSAVPLVEERDDVAVVRTFSKAHGLAGMRLGYAVTPADWADAYARVNTPFAVTELSCRAGLAALGDEDHVRRTVEVCRWSREYMGNHVRAPTWESGGNFVLADVGENDATADGAAVADACERRGLFVRDCSGHGLPGCIRISCGTRTETRRAVDVLNETLSERYD